MTEKRKILIIDDSDYVRSFLADLLTDAGYDVLEASKGADGVAVQNRERLDCILLDVILPDIDGLEVLKRIREKDTRLPVLMMTAEDPGWVRMTCENYGANGFLSKIFEPENILEVIENAIIDAES